MTLEQQDFHMGTIDVGTTPTFPVTGGFISEQYDVFPEFDVHLEHPSLVWVQQGTGAHARSAGESPMSNRVQVGGVFYVPMIRLKGHYTHRVALRHHTFDSTSGTDVHTYTYEQQNPPVGMKLVRRAPSGTSGQLTVDDPLRMGTLSWSGNPEVEASISSCDFTLFENSSSSATDNIRTGQGLSNQYSIYSQRDTQFRWPHDLSGQSQVSATAAWTDFKQDVAAYNATATAFLPTLSADDNERTITVSFMTNDNAIYIRTHGCEVVSGAQTAESLKYDTLAINYGGYYHHRSGWASSLQLLPQYRSYFVGRHDFLDGVQERLLQDTDDDVGTTKTNYRRASAIGSGDYIPSIEAAVVGPPVSDSVMDAVCVVDVPIVPWPETNIACSLELQELIDAFKEEQG
jgi:hypothetical protein